MLIFVIIEIAGNLLLAAHISGLSPRARAFDLLLTILLLILATGVLVVRRERPM